MKKISPAEQEANAEKLRAEARKLAAEAREAEARALKVELDALKVSDDDQARRASDEHHHLYRFSGGVGETSVQACMKKLTEWHRLDPGCPIEIVFSSPGGSIIDGMELFDFIVDLRAAGHHVTTGGTGMAASMAGVLVQAGDVRYVTREAWFLIHRAAFIALGKTYEIEDQVKLIQRIESRIIDIFTARSTLTKQKIKRNWERKDWWLSSDECLELGLVDEIRGSAV